MPTPIHRALRLACLTMVTSLVAAPPTQAADPQVRSWEVDRIWSVHPSAPPVLVTASPRQYLAYYNADRRLTLAWRDLDSDTWSRRQFPVVTTWAAGGHAQIGLGVDKEGFVHLVPYRRGLSEAPPAPPNMIYYRSTNPHDPASMEATYMVAPDEPNPGYPHFFNAPDGTLFFEFRQGGSGSGNHLVNKYDTATRTWERMPTLLDGRGQMSAYGGPRLGPDGRWHCLWMWRDTPHADTNHTLSYMVSDDLVNWRSPDGTPVPIPVNSDQPLVVVEPAKPGDGLINPSQWLGFDSKNRPVITYLIFGPTGKSAIRAARFENGAWKKVDAHTFGFRWDFGGTGAVKFPLDSGPVRPIGQGRLALFVKSDQEGERIVILDEETLAPIDDPKALAVAEAERPWRLAHKKPEVDFPLRPMEVHWSAGYGKSSSPGITYEVRSEFGPVNTGDLPVPEPWPGPTALRVFEIRHAQAVPAP